MKVTDLDKSQLPMRVILTEKFNLEESFSVGMIVEIRAFGIEDEHVYEDGGRVFWVDAYSLPKDRSHNEALSDRNWYTNETKEFDLNYFEHEYNTPDRFGAYYEKIYVMEEDEVFEELPKDEVLKGRKTYRHKGNPAEEKIHNLFVERFGEWPHMEQIVHDTDGRGEVSFGLTNRDKEMIITAIQWIGSPVGQAFMRDCGFEYKH